MKNLEYLKLKLGGWANQMASRFGAEVYLVGSSLHQEHPRDTDICIVISDEQFRARYGGGRAETIFEWEEDTWRPVWREARQKWAHDVGKLSLDVTLKLQLNIDLKIEPKTYSERMHKGKQRLRIDTIEWLGGDEDGEGRTETEVD